MKTIKSKFAISGLITVLGFTLTALGTIATVASTKNWSCSASFDAYFAKNDSLVMSDYYDLEKEVDLKPVQVEGDSSCGYKISNRRRFSSKYTTIVDNLSFKDNNTYYGTYSITNNGGIRDIQFKIEKTNGINSNSKLYIEVGKYK